jgi:heme exporter protein A
MIRKNTLICENLCIFRGNEMILENVSFSLMPGACIRIVGENGSGKTSLLRCIARLDDSNHGNITYNSCCVDEFINEYKQIILYISDKEQLNDRMTVYETISFWAALYSAEILLEAAVHTTNLVEYLDVPIKFLSKGLKKRVVLMRLLLQRARIWLLDEPFVNLDVETIDIVSNVMNSHLSNGGIIVFSDHMQDNLNSTSKDIAQLKNMGYKVGSSSQLKKQEIILLIKDFKRFRI